MKPCDGHCYKTTSLVHGCDYTITIMKMYEATQKISGYSVILEIVLVFIILLLFSPWLFGIYWLWWRSKEEDDNRSVKYLTTPQIVYSIIWI